MAKRKRSDGESVSLFPFLSILACVIGTLTLMITAVVLGQMDREQSPEVRQRAEEFEKLQQQLAADREEVEKLKQLMAAAEDLREELAAALDEISQLEREQKAQLDESGKTDSEGAKLLAEANRLRKRIAELEPDLPELKIQIEQLEQELKSRKDPPQEAEVVVRPGGSGVKLDPTFVECTTNGVVILDEKNPITIRRGDLNKEGGAFHQLLDRVAGTKDGTVIFLMRPDAVGTYNTARNVARTHYGPNGYCPNGKLPVSTQGRIDLSLFKQAATE